MKERAKILIIDSSLETLKFVSEVVLYNGYDVVKTTSSKRSLVSAVEYLPDLIIMDVSMPHIDGYGIMSELKNYEETKNIPVMVLSKSKNLDDLKKSKETGVVAYILKPLSINTFVEKIRSIVPLANYDGIGTYLNGDNFVNEEDTDDDMTSVYTEINQILRQRKSASNVKNVLKKGKKIPKINVIDGFPVRFVPITALKLGMVPARNIVSKGGMIVHPAGLEINDKVINKIKDFQFDTDNIAIRG